MALNVAIDPCAWRARPFGHGEPRPCCVLAMACTAESAATPTRTTGETPAAVADRCCSTTDELAAPGAGIYREFLIDPEVAASLQREADSGHQPWRLDPDLVARAALEAEGIDQSEARIIQVPSPPSRARDALCYPARTYEIELVQPAQQGPSGIWMVSLMRAV